MATSYERSQLATLYRDTLLQGEIVRVKFVSIAGETNWLDLSLDTYTKVMQTIIAAAETDVTA